MRYYLTAVSLLALLLLLADKYSCRFPALRPREGLLRTVSLIGGASAILISACLIDHPVDPVSMKVIRRHLVLHLIVLVLLRVIF